MERAGSQVERAVSTSGARSVTSGASRVHKWSEQSPQVERVHLPFFAMYAPPRQAELAVSLDT